jgi:pyruvate dehydrogenase E1 component alpha subunit
MSREPSRILDVSGELVGEPPLPVERVRDLYAAMVEARVYDRKASAMQRQGRLATYASFEGQEAAQIGTTAAMAGDDWLVATYRDAAAMWHRGYPWVNLLLGRTGDERGGHPPEGVRVLPPSITVGGHMIHAVGLAWAEMVQGTSAAAVTMFGDGATSEGDFHEAMNFAGVYRTPTVFVCQNNGWAISMPRDRQTASTSIAIKADAYGMAGVLVDGNDVLAVYAAAAGALERARAGEGATLIEAVTYRIGAHTTADDHSRYRRLADVETWRAADPIERVERYLTAHGAWDEGWRDQIVAEAGDRVEQGVEAAEALPPFSESEIFDAMFAEATPTLERQREMAARREGGGAVPGWGDG